VKDAANVSIYIDTVLKVETPMKDAIATGGVRDLLVGQAFDAGWCHRAALLSAVSTSADLRPRAGTGRDPPSVTLRRASLELELAARARGCGPACERRIVEDAFDDRHEETADLRAWCHLQGIDEVLAGDGRGRRSRGDRGAPAPSRPGRRAPWHRGRATSRRHSRRADA